MGKRALIGMQGFKWFLLKRSHAHAADQSARKTCARTHTHSSLRDSPCFGWYSTLHTWDTAITRTKYKNRFFSCMASSSRHVLITDYTMYHDISITQYCYRLKIFGSTIQTVKHGQPFSFGFASFSAEDKTDIVLSLGNVSTRLAKSKRKRRNMSFIHLRHQF